MTELEKYHMTYFNVDKDVLNKISLYFKPIQINKGIVFHKRGRDSDRLGFVPSGKLSSFYLIKKKKFPSGIWPKCILQWTWKVSFYSACLLEYTSLEQSLQKM
ncbi:hypothetical protein [Shivajiella indica]|uniref:hypothetical protein n=1 Tax=Shivajiella indica TaxID=872115 RepID=UPI0036D28687